jgi:hypothetical protein
MTVLPNSDPAIIMRRFPAGAYRRRAKCRSAAVSGIFEFEPRQFQKIKYKQPPGDKTRRSGSGTKSPKRALGSEPAEEFRDAPAHAINSSDRTVSPCSGPDPSSAGIFSYEFVNFMITIMVGLGLLEDRCFAVQARLLSSF